MMKFSQQQPMNPVTRRFGARAAAFAVTAILLFSAQSAFAVPYTYSYFVDAETTNTLNGVKDPNVLVFTSAQAVSFTRAEQTISATGGGATASTTFSASITPGLLGATSISGTTGTYGGGIGTGLSSFGQQQLHFQDTITPTGGTVGDHVSLTFTLNLDSLLTTNVSASGSAGSALCGYGQVDLSATVNGGQVAGLARNLCVGSDTMTVSATFDAVIGTAYTLDLGMNILSQSQIGAGATLGNFSAIDASHTGELFLAAPTGITLTAASGATYSGGNGTTVPEPSTLALLGIGLAGAFGARRGRKI